MRVPRYGEFVTSSAQLVMDLIPCLNWRCPRCGADAGHWCESGKPPHWTCPERRCDPAVLE